MSSRFRAWHAAVLGIALFIVLRFALPAIGTLPRALTAEEADAFLGAKLLVERLHGDMASDPPAGDDAPEATMAPLTARMRAGFETTPTHPRLAELPPEKGAARAALEAPLPRWLGALGLGVLPSTSGANNLERAATAASLAIALAIALLVFGLRGHGTVFAIALVGGLLGLPGLVDAAASAGHGAASVLAMTLFVLGLERLLRTGGVAIHLGLGAALGLLLGVHPGALALVLVAFVAWAIHQPPDVAPAAPGVPPDAPGTLPLPRVPLLLLALPVVALVVLIAIWPALWSETGKRLGAWLLDFGSTRSAPHEVLGLAFDQATGRSAQAFTALLQWVAFTPLPLLGLWLVGFAVTVRRGRAGPWVPVLALVALLAVGALDGSLFGARNSLLALTWVPTAITAAHGLVRALGFVEAWLADHPVRLLPASRRARTALFTGAALLVPLLQAGKGTTLGMARQGGAELRAPLPLALVERAAAERPFAVIAALPRPAALAPALEVAREGLGLDLRVGTPDEAELLLVTLPSGAAPPSELVPRLESARELARDPRPGVIVTLSERSDE